MSITVSTISPTVFVIVSIIDGDAGGFSVVVAVEEAESMVVDAISRVVDAVSIVVDAVEVATSRVVVAVVVAKRSRTFVIGPAGKIGYLEENVPEATIEKETIWSAKIVSPTRLP